MEMIVVIALFALLIGALTSFLIDMFRGTSRAGVRNTLQTEGLLISEEMMRVLRSTGQPGLSIQSDASGSAFGAVPLKTTTTTGQQVWDTELRFYFWRAAEGKLMRKLYPPIVPGVALDFRPETPPLLTPDQFTGLMADDGRLLSDKVTSFTIAEADGLISFELQMAQSVRNGPDETYSISRKLSFKS